MFSQKLGQLTTPWMAFIYTPSRGVLLNRPASYIIRIFSLFDKHLFFQYIYLKNHTFCTILTIIPVHSAQFRTFAIFCPSVMYILGGSVGYNTGFSISGSCKAALCFSAICWAVCWGTPYCCPACTGAVSAMP